MPPVFNAADILLPGADTDMTVWPALACDQFTSQPEYWQQAETLCAGKHSTLHLTLPEVYLEAPSVQTRIAAIHTAMEEAVASVLTNALHGFVYVERRFPDKPTPRCGLVGAVDLEAYSYEAGAQPMVRPSENTVVERIPPRLAVRYGAALETPHILMLLDDDSLTVLEPLAARAHAGSLPQVYDTDLMLGGGHVTGWAVTDAKDITALEQAIATLGTQAAFDEKYPQAAGSAPLVMAVGDGNHSLATAKAYWEGLKTTLTPAQQIMHPARYCLVELENVHSSAIEIEPIHRAVFGTDQPTLAVEFAAWLAEHGAQAFAPGCGCACHGAAAAAHGAKVAVDANNCDTVHDAAVAHGADAAPNTAPAQLFTLVGGAPELDAPVQVANAPHPLAVGTLELFLTDFCAAHPDVKVDYIHGEASVRALAKNGAVGVLLPEFAKSDLFRGVVLGGVLPKKTFSMGEATEKRYYLECRAIAP